MTNSKQDNSRVISKIKKLLAMAADTSSPHEASIAAEQARKMMDKNQLDYDDIEFHEDDFAEATSGNSYVNYPVWRQTIAVCVAKLNDCNATFRADRNSSGRKVVLFQGFVGDVELCNYLNNYLVACAESQCRAYFKALGAMPVRLKNEWLRGFANAIGVRVKEINEERNKMKTTSGRDLVVVKGALVAHRFGAAKYSTVRRHRQYDEEAAAARKAGRSAGQSTSIHRAVNGDSQASLGYTA